MKSYAILLIMVFPLCSCRRDLKQGPADDVSYFVKGELSKVEFVDSIRNKQFTEILKDLDEPSLRNSKQRSSVRVTVLSSFYNPYCIRIEQTEFAAKVVFKFKGDRPGFVRAGLDNLNLTYESSHERMDSLVNDLLKSVTKYDFYSGLDEVSFVRVDGVSYLLECFCNGEYKVIDGWNLGVHKGNESIFDIINKVHSFVPEGMIVSFQEATKLEDVLFTVLKKDSLSGL